MPQHPNAAVVRQGFDAFNRGDVETLESLIASDAVQHIPGSHRLSGDHKGRDAILELYAEIAHLTQGTFRADPLHIFASDYDAVVIYDATGHMQGRELDETFCMLFQIANGKVVDLDVLLLDGDTTADDAFWGPTPPEVVHDPVRNP